MWSTFLVFLSPTSTFQFPCSLLPPTPHSPLPFWYHPNTPLPLPPRKELYSNHVCISKHFQRPINHTGGTVHVHGLLSYESEPCTQPSLSTCHVDLPLQSDAVSQTDMEVNTNCYYVTVGRQSSFSVTGPTRPCAPGCKTTCLISWRSQPHYCNYNASSSVRGCY